MAEGTALVLPPPLPPGGTIGVAAASSPFEERSEIDRSVRWYEERGYRVKLADCVYARDDFVAGDAAARARDVNELFADPEVDVVQLLRGGYGASQVVPHLDFDTIAENPKPLVGYSDVTALHVAIRQPRWRTFSSTISSPSAFRSCTTCRWVTATTCARFRSAAPHGGRAGSARASVLVVTPERSRRDPSPAASQ